MTPPRRPAEAGLRAEDRILGVSLRWQCVPQQHAYSTFLLDGTKVLEISELDPVQPCPAIRISFLDADANLATVIQQ
jgi:hypothetical protein